MESYNGKTIVDAKGLLTNLHMADTDLTEIHWGGISGSGYHYYSPVYNWL